MVLVVQLKEGWFKSHPLYPIPYLTKTLLGLICRSGPRWIWMFFRLIVFTMLILPGCIKAVFYYFFNPNIIKNIRYGPNARNLLDIYVPSWDRTEQFPVVVLMTGGAWIIGYKAWFCLVAKWMRRFGILCVMPDYRNFPQGTCSDMVQDSHYAMKWVFENIHYYGGDPNNIYLCGQSAGAHLAFLSVFDQCGFQGEVPDELDKPLALKEKINELRWPAHKLKGLIGLSGPYNLKDDMEVFHRRGLHREVFRRIFENALGFYSPTIRVNRPSFESYKCLVPPVYLLHGTSDKTCTVDSTIFLAQALERQHHQVCTKYYRGTSHSGPIVEDLLCVPIDREDIVVNDLVNIVLHQTLCHKSVPVPSKDIEPNENLQSPFLLELARLINPF